MKTAMLFAKAYLAGYLLGMLMGWPASSI